MIEKLKSRATDLGKAASTSDVIYAALRDAIIRGELAEGATLRQDSIAQLFNVSRIPVREALMRLEAQGLATSERYKGVVVASMSAKEIEEIFEFRALLEPKVIELSVERMSDDSLAEAEHHCTAFSQESDPARWGDLNRLFHSALYRDCGRPYYLSVIDATNDRVERYIRAQLDLTAGMTRARVDHSGILEACKARDGKAAARLTREHISNAGKTLLEFLKVRAKARE